MLIGRGQMAWLIVASVALAGLVWLWRSASSGETGAPESTVAAGTPSQDAQILAEISALRHDNERLRAHVDRLEKSRSNRTKRKAGASANVGSTDASDEEFSTEEETREAERIAAQIEAIQTGFQSQARDPAWSATANREIAAVFKPDPSSRPDQHENLAGSTIRESDCRATLCRVVVSHADEQALTSFAHAFISRLPSDLSQGVFAPTELAEGQLTTVIYLAKANTEFPQPAADTSP